MDGFKSGVGDLTILNELFHLLRYNIQATVIVTPTYRDYRPGDVRRSQTDIGKARRIVGYAPTHRIAEGITVAMPWYVNPVINP